MPLVKLTLPTALPTMRQTLAELGRAAKEAAPLPGLELVARGLDQLEQYCGRKPLDLELVVVSPLDAEAAARAAAWIGAGFPAASLASGSAGACVIELPARDGAVALAVRVHSLEDGTAQAAGTPRPAVLVLVVGSTATLTAETLAVLEPLLQDRPRVFLIGPVAEAALKPLVELARARAWSCGVTDAARFPDTTLAAHLSSPPWDAAHDLFRAYSAAVGLDSLASVFQLWMEQQARDLRTRRAATQAKLGVKPTAAAVRAATVPADLAGDVRARIQRHSQEFERGANERLQDLLGVPAGSLARETEAMILGLDDLAQEVRTTKIETRIPEAFLEKLLRTVRERVARHCAADLVAQNDLLRLLAQEIERALALAQGPSVVPQFAYLAEDRVRRMLDMTVAVHVQYRGELPHQGFSEYFASVRKYSMLLVMGASMFGMSSLMRQYREITVPLTILLVLGGTYSVISSTRRERVESLERELEMARNALRPELKRIFGDVQKAWSATLIGFMNEQIARALAEVEAAVKDHQARRGAEASPSASACSGSSRSSTRSTRSCWPPSRRATASRRRSRRRSARCAGYCRGPRPGAAAAAAALRGATPGPAVPSALGALQEARAKAEALRAQQAVGSAAPSAAASALEAAKAKMAALRAAAAEKAAARPNAGATPAAATAAPATPASHAVSAAPVAPPPAEAGAVPRPRTSPTRRRSLEALKAQAAARKAKASLGAAHMRVGIDLGTTYSSSPRWTSRASPASFPTAPTRTSSTRPRPCTSRPRATPSSARSRRRCSRTTRRSR